MTKCFAYVMPLFLRGRAEAETLFLRGDDRQPVAATCQGLISLQCSQPGLSDLVPEPLVGRASSSLSDLRGVPVVKCSGARIRGKCGQARGH